MSREFNGERASNGTALNGKYITTAELAARWSVCEGTLRNYRHKGEGPPSVKVGRIVLYNIKAVKQYEQDCRRVKIMGDKE